MKKLKVFRKNMAVMGGIVVAMIILVNFMASRHHRRFDFTYSGDYSLSSQTLKLIKGLDSPLKIRIFDKPGSHLLRSASDLLEEYKYHSDHIHVEEIDPDRQPAVTKKYKVKRYGTIILEYKKKTEKADKGDEEAITNAILKLTRDLKKTVYFLKGHGEGDLDSNAKDGYSMIYKEILGQNYEVKQLLLMRAEKVPDDCFVLVVMGPRKPLLPKEEKILNAYLDKGGKAFFLLDPTPDGVGLIKFMSRWGVKVGEDVIVDKMSRLFGGDYFMPVINNYNKHPITEGFTIASFLPLTRSVTPLPYDKINKEKIDPVSLAFTSQGSWAETDLKSPEISFDDGKDTAGPVSVMVAVRTTAEKPEKQPKKPENKKKEEEGALVVMGDSDFVNNSYYNLSGNSDLFLNIISWLAEEGDLVCLRPKPKTARALAMTDDQVNLLFYLTVLVMPLLVIISGVVVWSTRRK
ncbi:MAG: GldG family protein [bacterium]